MNCSSSKEHAMMRRIICTGCMISHLVDGKYLRFPDAEEDSDVVEFDLRLVVRMEDKQVR